VGIAVNTAELKKAAKDFSDVVGALVQATSDIVDQHTKLSSMSWGAFGAMTVSGSYNPARDYQLRQLQDFVKCLHGINSGLYSVALHYDKVELENAKKAYDAIDGYWNPHDKAAALAKVHKWEKTVRKDTETFNMAKSDDDSYHH
jgi:uncharacterized protein YukE